MERAEKEEIEAISGSLSDAAISVCADYRGLTVSKVTGLRRSLRGAGAEAKVVKNTLAKISLEKVFKDSSDEAELGKFIETFNGPSFLVTSKDDPVSPAKVLTQFAKEHSELELKGAWFEGAFVDVDGLKALSDLQAGEELLAKLLNLINAPAVQLLRTINAPAQQIVQVLEGHRANLEK